MARAATALPRAVAIALVMAAWVAVTHFRILGPTIVASPTEVARVLWDAAIGAQQAPRLYAHAGATIQRALTGWLLAATTGVALGLILGARRSLHLGSEPVIELARAIPPVMAFPLFLIAFDFGHSAYVATIVFGCLPAMVLAVAHGRQALSPARLELLQVFGAGRLARAFVAVMDLLPACLLGARITLSMSLVIAVVTEMVMTPRSGVALGALAKEAEISFATPVFYATVVVIATVGYAANVLMRRLGERLGAA